MKPLSRALLAAFVVGLLSAPAPSKGQQQELRANARAAAGQLQLRVTARSADELERVRALSGNVLSCAGSGLGTFEVTTTPGGRDALSAAGIVHEVVRADLGRHLDEVLTANDRLRSQKDAPWFAAYRTLDEIEARLFELAAQYPALAQLETLGGSLEGRPIRLLRVSAPGAAAGRGAFVVSAAQHAREWVTPMTVMYVAERLLQGYGSDARASAALDKLEFLLVPVTNPDGYVYSHEANAMWRKNRRRNGGACDGVDLNRNWSHGFGGEGSSPDPCNDVYRGPAAFTEPELLGLKGLLDALAAQRRLMVHWDVHSNAAAILSPWGHTRAQPREIDAMNRLGAVIQAGMAGVRGKAYGFGPIATRLYVASGVATDYVFGELGAMAWGVELAGDTFMPPQPEILPIAQEGLAGLLALAETVPGRF
jgi:hypothetical protein